MQSSRNQIYKVIIILEPESPPIVLISDATVSVNLFGQKFGAHANIASQRFDVKLFNIGLFIATYVDTDMNF